MIAGNAVALGYSAAQAPTPGLSSALAQWLGAHGLRHGLGSGPQANVITADSEGRVAVEPTVVRGGRVAELLYQAQAVRAAFGPPARRYRFDGCTVLVWNVNLLTRLR